MAMRPDFKHTCGSRRKISVWETRGLRRDDQKRVADGTYRHAARDFRKFLNDWKPIARLAGGHK